MNIQTARLELRDYQDPDAELDDVLAFAGDPKVAEHSTWGPLTREEARAFLRDSLAEQPQAPRTAYQLAIVPRAAGRIVGNCSLHIRDARTREAELDYALRADEWGKGYATEAAKAVLSFGFQELHLRRIFGSTSPHNRGSRSVLQKLGMKSEGVLRKNTLLRGHWRDSEIFAILEDERSRESAASPGSR